MRGWNTEARARGVVAYAKIADKASDEGQPGPVILARSRSFLLSRTSLALRIQSGGSIAAKQGIGAAERPNWRIIEGEADGRKKAVMTQAVLLEGREEAAMTRDGEDKRCRGISSERNPYTSFTIQRHYEGQLYSLPLLQYVLVRPLSSLAYIGPFVDFVPPCLIFLATTAWLFHFGRQPPISAQW